MTNSNFQRNDNDQKSSMIKQSLIRSLIAYVSVKNTIEFTTEYGCKSYKSWMNNKLTSISR